MTLDFIVGVPLSLEVNRKAYDTILIVVNYSTKLAKYYPVLKIITTEQLGDVVI